MKKLLILVFTLTFFSSVFAQMNNNSGNWATIDYTYSKGPVSPEYQLNYTIFIDQSGNGKLTYTKASVTSEYDFKVTKKKIKKLNEKLKRSDVFSVPAEDMKSSDNMIGGATRNMQITMWQSPDLDARPTIIDIPSHLNETYSENMNEVYEQLEKMVPQSVWDKADGK